MMVADYRRKFDGQLVLRDAETGSVARASRHPDKQLTRRAGAFHFARRASPSGTLSIRMGLTTLCRLFRLCETTKRKEHP
jgi:hypothetical protein